MTMRPPEALQPCSLVRADRLPQKTCLTRQKTLGERWHHFGGLSVQNDSRSSLLTRGLATYFVSVVQDEGRHRHSKGTK